MTEAELQKKILQYLKIKGIPARRNNTGAAVYGRGNKKRFVRYNEKGTADISCVLPPNGRACYIEVKSEFGILSAAQIDFMLDMEDAGAVCIVARKLEDVINVVEAIENA